MLKINPVYVNGIAQTEYTFELRRNKLMIEKKTTHKYPDIFSSRLEATEI